MVVAQAGGLGELAQDVGITVHGRHAAAWAEGIAASLADSGRPPPAAALQRAQAHDWPRVLAQWCVQYHRSLGTRPRVPEGPVLMTAGAGD